MKIRMAVVVAASSSGTDITIPDKYEAIANLLGAYAITGIADTSNGALTFSGTDVDVALKDERTITQNTALSNGGFLVVIYEPAIDLKTA